MIHQLAQVGSDSYQYEGAGTVKSSAGSKKPQGAVASSLWAGRSWSFGKLLENSVASASLEGEIILLHSLVISKENIKGKLND